MPNFTYCGLATSVLLFFFSTSLYILLGIRCRNQTSKIANQRPTICTNIDNGLANILFIFGCIFMVCGFMILGFIIVLWFVDGEHKKQIDEV